MAETSFWDSLSFDTLTCSLGRIVTFSKVGECFRKEVAVEPKTMMQKISSAFFGSTSDESETIIVEGDVPQWVYFVAYCVFLAVAIVAYTSLVNLIPKSTSSFEGMGNFANRNSYQAPITRAEQLRMYNSNNHSSTSSKS